MHAIVSANTMCLKQDSVNRIAFTAAKTKTKNTLPNVTYFCKLAANAERRVAMLRLAQKMLKRKLQKNDALIAFSVTAKPTTETSE